jgi:hypothetical protein
MEEGLGTSAGGRPEPTYRAALVLAALVVAVGFGLVGCGGGDVADRFKRLTGVALAGQAGGSRTLKIPSLPTGRAADEARTRYDIPVPAARKATKDGALEFIADREATTIDYAQSLGRIRLISGPSGSGGTTS